MLIDSYELYVNHLLNIYYLCQSVLSSAYGGRSPTSLRGAATGGWILESPSLPCGSSPSASSCSRCDHLHWPLKQEYVSVTFLDDNSICAAPTGKVAGTLCLRDHILFNHMLHVTSSNTPRYLQHRGSHSCIAIPRFSVPSWVWGESRVNWWSGC